jgi:hypothetical protein
VSDLLMGSATLLLVYLIGQAEVAAKTEVKGLRRMLELEYPGAWMSDLSRLQGNRQQRGGSSSNAGIFERRLSQTLHIE